MMIQSSNSAPGMHTAMFSSSLSRRSALTALAAAPGGLLFGASAQAEDAPAPLKGNLKHSVCKWCYKDMTLDELAVQAKAMGILGIDLLGAEDWPTIQKHGLTCPMAAGPGNIKEGWNNPALHDDLVKKSEEMLPVIAAAGLPNMIVFSGNRNGLPDAEGIKHCATGLKRITPLAEQLGVTICMELLNSKVNHKDYQCDKTAWGVDLVNEVASERFKLLYDIYHMQIMEGDVIRTIQESHAYIGHYHTAGNPGRNEIDDTQELNYPAIMRAIKATGFKGFVAQEFIPKRKPPLDSLRAAVKLCSV